MWAVSRPVSYTHLTWVRYGKPDVSMTLNGSLAGLVAITAGCDTVSPFGAFFIGFVEMCIRDRKKPGVVINEAVELTKKYGADEDYQFVNGLLGTVAREQGLDAEPEQL